MRKKFIFAAALCLTTLSLTDNINAAVQITQEVQQDGRTIRGTVIDNTGKTGGYKTGSRKALRGWFHEDRKSVV